MKNLNVNLISEEHFLQVYNKYVPNKWTKFVFRYFSRSTQKKDKWVSQLLTAVFIALFLTGLTGTILGLSYVFVSIPTFILLGLLVIIGILKFGAFIMNNNRIRKIRKELGITKEDYDFLVGLYVKIYEKNEKDI
jgi:ABC-type multidrug transport system permease subunit